MAQRCSTAKRDLRDITPLVGGSHLGGTFGSFPSTIKPIGIAVKDVTQSSSGIDLGRAPAEGSKHPELGQIWALDDYRHIRKKLLLRVIEHNSTDSHAFVNLGNQLSAQERIEVQLEGTTCLAR